MKRIIAASSAKPDLGEFKKYYKWDKVVTDSNREYYDDDLYEIGHSYGYKFIGYAVAKARYTDLLGDEYNDAVVYVDEDAPESLIFCQVVHDRIYEFTFEDVEEYVESNRW